MFERHRIVAIVVVAVLSSAPVTHAQTQRVVLGSTGYALAPPVGWKVESNLSHDLVLRCTAPGDAGIIEVYTTTKAMTTAAMCQAYEKRFQDGDKDWFIMTESKAGILGQVAYFRSYSGVENGTPIHIQAVFFVKDSRTFVLSAITEQAKARELHWAANRAIVSLDLVGAPEPPRQPVRPPITREPPRVGIPVGKTGLRLTPPPGWTVQPVKDANVMLNLVPQGGAGMLQVMGVGPVQANMEPQAASKTSADAIEQSMGAQKNGWRRMEERFVTGGGQYAMFRRYKTPDAQGASDVQTLCLLSDGQVYMAYGVTPVMFRSAQMQPVRAALASLLTDPAARQQLLEASAPSQPQRPTTPTTSKQPAPESPAMPINVAGVNPFGGSGFPTAPSPDLVEAASKASTYPTATPVKDVGYSIPGGAKKVPEGRGRFTYTVNGLRVGYRQYIGNALILEKAWKNNKFEGLQRTWTEDGKLLSSESYKENRRHGAYRSHQVVAQGKLALVLERHYKDGMQHGPERRYDGSGRVKSEDMFFEGRQIGSIYYWPGTTIVKSEWHKNLDNKYQGWTIKNASNGNPESRELYDNGRLLFSKSYDTKTCNPINETPYDGDRKKHGPMRAWTRDGKPNTEQSYKHGKLHGVCKWWHATGKLRNERSYSEGQMHGRSTTWDEAGMPTLEEYYLNGKRVTKEQFAAAGG